MSKECTTHHHACDCREAKFKQLECEHAALAKALDKAYKKLVSLTKPKERKP